ncbi:two pore domain potassium channel family protein [Mycoplasma tullyi]|uniref:Two pore domain potassium channel family protein n=1 Tax=Mycoplasma tullyi TaxID=1612150 RepID=A0A7D7U2L1_9MOLU|nr:potassium channel family protein [Mycoplasma tullyi]QMT98389.1 two pore domain potassium channel family protein [Mycoplasma tullyi]
MNSRLNNLKIGRNKLMRLLSIIVWSRADIDDHLLKYEKRIKLFRGIYALVIVFASLISFVTLVITPKTNNNNFFAQFAKVTLLLTFFVFIADWLAHAFTYKYAMRQPKLEFVKALLKYFFTFNSIVIILCILSSGQAIKFFVSELSPTNELIFASFQSLALVKTIRLFMVLSLFKPFGAITNVFVNQKKLLASVFLIIIVLIILFAIIIWSQETVELLRVKSAFLAKVSDNYLNFPQFTLFIQLSKLMKGSVQYEDIINKITDGEVQAAANVLNPTDAASFASLSSGYVQNFTEAFYFTTITLTTVGYGDFVPHAPISRVIVSFISLLAISIIAIPSGIIAGSFLSEMQKAAEKNKSRKKKPDNKKEQVVTTTDKKKPLDQCEFIPIKQS